MKTQKIFDLVNSGHFQEAEKLIARLIKSKKISIDEQISLAVVYQKIGKDEKAIKLLGPEKSLNEMRSCTEAELKKQIKLANIFSYVRAKYVAKRMFENIQTVADEKNLDLIKVNPQYYYYLGAYTFNLGNEEEALEIQRKNLELQKGNYRREMPSILEISRICVNLERPDEGIEALKSIEERVPKDHVIHQYMISTRLGHHYYQKEDYKKARSYYEQSYELSKGQEVRDRAYLCRVWGLLEMDQGNVDKAKELFREGLIACAGLKNPFTSVTTTHWMEQIDPDSVSLEQKIGVRCHPCYAPASYLAGKKFDTNIDLPIPDWYYRRYKDHNNDSWTIRNGNIEAINYFKSQTIMKDESNIVLDLVSKTLFNKEKDEIVNLTDYQAVTLTAIIGAGGFGVSRWILADYVYRQNFINVDTGFQRLSKIVTSLRKLGFHINLENNYFTITLNKDWSYYLPMHLENQAKYKYLFQIKEQFSRNDVENIFHISSSTAKKWIKTWLEDESIDKDQKNNKNVLYIPKKAS